MTMRWTVSTAVVAAVLMGSFQPAVAQPRGGQVVEGLFRAFLETQVEKERIKAQERAREDERRRLEELERQRAAQQPPVVVPVPVPGGGRPNFPGRPGFPPGPQPQPQPVPQIHPTVGQYRTQMDGFHRTLATLIGDLNSAPAASNAQVRSLLPRVAELQQLSATMVSASAGYGDPSAISPVYVDLDARWRNLSFELQQVRGLPPGCVQHVNRLDGYTDAICSLLTLDPQFDYRGARRQCVMASAFLMSLHDEIEHRLARDPRFAEICADCRLLDEQVTRLAFTLDRRSNYDEFVPKYSDYIQNWRKLCVKLYTIGDPAVDRAMSRVTRAHDALYRLLWIPPSYDRAYINYMASRLNSEVAALFAILTVRELVQLPPADQQVILDNSRLLYSSSTNFYQMCSNNAPLADLGGYYYDVYANWDTMSGFLTQLTRPEIAAQVRSIIFYNNHLREILNVSVTLDRPRLLQLAAATQNMAEYLLDDFQRYSRYYNPNYRGTAMAAGTKFQQASAALHGLAAGNANPRQLAAAVQQVAAEWAVASKVVDGMPQQGLPANWHARLRETQGEINPVVDELNLIVGRR